MAGMPNPKTYMVEKAQHGALTSKRPTDLDHPKTPRPSPGRFRHPKTSEIIARQSAMTLTPGRIRNALINLAPLLLSIFYSNVVHTSTTEVLSVSGISNASWYSSVTLALLRLVLCTNIILLLRPAIPYISKQDNFSDIPLTPSQRALLGLNPSTQSTPASAASGAHFITPPKYRRLSGSFSGTSSGGVATDRRSISANYSDSPLSTSRYTVGFSPTPQSIRRASGSPFSPSPTASPLFHKAVNLSSQQAPEIDFSASTQSLGLSTGNGLGRSQSLRERSRRESLDPTSPTPGTKTPQLVPGVNYKWLYEKGRKLPKSESFGSFGL